MMPAVSKYAMLSAVELGSSSRQTCTSTPLGGPAGLGSRAMVSEERMRRPPAPGTH